MDEKPAKGQGGDYRNWLKARLAGYSVRQSIFALFCLTVIAVYAMYRLSDPENIIINIIIAIGAFANLGRSEQRQSDAKPPTPKGAE